MKKTLISLIFCAVLTISNSYADLNPYAYGLSSTLDGTTLTVNYSLNSAATSVNVVIMDGAEEVKTVTCNDKLSKGSHSVDISTLDLPTGKSLTWKVEVKGTSVDKPTKEETTYDLYCPHGLAIDKNPESEHFGRILVTESMQAVASESADAYVSGGKGAGIYVFNPDFTTDKTRYSGGIDFTRKLASNGYQPYQVEISEDGRIFVSSCDINGVAVWEVSKDLNTWTPVISGTNDATDYTIKKNGNFFAGLNVAMDVKGSGDDLTLLLYSTNNKGIAYNQSGYRLDEYKLGTATTFTGTPKNIINGGAFGVVHTDVDFIYDGEGGYWFGGSRGGNAGQPNLVHINANGVEDYRNETNTHYGGGGVLVHNGMLIKGKLRTSSTDGNFGVYTVGKDANGKTTLTEKWAVKSPGLGRNHNAFAVDYAENLYVVGNNGEKMLAYALPYSETVATPCASKYAFVIPPQLNPFAYKLSSELSDDEKNLTIKYSLNANATSVNWVLLDGNNVVKTVDLTSLGLEKGDYTTTISTTDFPQYKALTWKIEVKGVAVDEATEYPISYDFYHPSSVDIDNNPENPTFGLILCNEAMQSVKGQKQSDTGEDYLSSSLGAGIYAFNPAFENTGKYNGGIEFTTTRADGTGTAYVPRRIRISNDGRIFVTSLNTDGNYLWEVNPMNLNEWTPIFKGTLNSNKELVDASSNFVAAPNIGFDVRGEGANLKLLMLSSNLRGFPPTYAASAFKCHEYNLGRATTWSATPSKTILSGKYMINYTGDQVAYDAEGGVWFCQHQGTAKDDYPSLVHIDKNGVEDYKEVVNNRMGGGFRFNNDFTKVVIAGIADGTNNSKKATVYAVSKDANGKPVLTEETIIDMKTVGNNLNDFAWDYAGNLYACGNSSEKLVAWAMPHASDDVVATPAASKYAFSIGKYTMTVNTNDENKGTVSGGGEYLEGDVVTLTAIAKEGYELLYWSDRSTENPRNITMTKNEALSAYFVKEYVVEPTFTIEKVWENTNVPGSAAGYQAVGWDGKIYMQNKTEGKIKVYNNGTDAAVDYAASNTSGQQIAVDEVGNLIVFNATFYSINPNAIQIYKNGSTTAKAISFTLPHPERCDFISASGDIYSAEGGYVYFYCQNKNAVNRVKITNGELASVDAIGNTANPATSVSHVMVDIFGNLAAHCRSTAVYAINSYTGETTAFNASLFGIKLSTLGGCSFELGGKEFWAYNVGTTHYNSEWNLYNMTDKQFLSGETLYAKDKVSKKNTGPANWLNVQVVDENTAYIYQFCPEVAVAVWKVTMHEVVLRDTENNEDLLIDLNGSTTNVSVYRSLTGGMYNTLCLPFDVNELTGTPLENATVWQYNGATVKGDGTSKEIFLEFDEVESITAGKPYLVEPAEDIKAPMEFKDVTISVTKGNDVAQGAVTMHGILHPTELQANNKSILFLVENNNLAWANVTANMNGMRAYFEVNEPSLLTARTRAYIRREPTVATDMENITTPETEIKKVIYNGSLYIIRGDEVYTIQGTKVK